MTKGKVAAVRGPVIDVTFAHGALPKINDALLLQTCGGNCVMGRTERACMNQRGIWRHNTCNGM